ncbi:MAG: hypothetical protein LH605_11945 [Microbacteriaceae bacterium]|nr:hypothetical protein [Microbacteriaceae bacterium]
MTRDKAGDHTHGVDAMRAVALQVAEMATEVARSAGSRIVQAVCSPIGPMKFTPMITAHIAFLP